MQVLAHHKKKKKHADSVKNCTTPALGGDSLPDLPLKERVRMRELRPGSGWIITA